MLDQNEMHAGFDPEAATRFADTVGEIVNHGAITVMLSVGHRLGLFDLLAERGAVSSQDLADAGGLSERYVREWLAAMVTGGIVKYDADTRTYALPPEHAACLTRSATLGNLAVYAQFVPMAGATQERILDCFRTGSGMSYDDYPCFHEIMHEDSSQTVVAGLFDHILPLAPDLDERLRSGIDVLDAGCGKGGALLALAARYPDSRFVGYDLCGDAIADAQAQAAAAGLRNVHFEQRDLTGFEEPNKFDFIASFDAVHDQKDPQGLVRGIYKSLRAGGTYLMQDIGGSARLENNLDFPFAAFLYTASCVHCMPVSIGQGGPGLGTMWGWETALDMLREVGFAETERHVLPHDPMNVWFVSRKEADDA